MTQYRLESLVEKKEQQTGFRLMMKELGEKTGISLQTLSRMVSPNNDPENRYFAKSSILDRLCSFSNREIQEMVVHLKDPTTTKSSLLDEPGVSGRIG